jgi:hypothetical protein
VLIAAIMMAKLPRLSSTNRANFPPAPPKACRIFSWPPFDGIEPLNEPLQEVCRLSGTRSLGSALADKVLIILEFGEGEG